MIKNELQICEGINWIDVTNPSRAEMEDLSRMYNLNSHMVKDCLQPEHLPKYEFVDEVHFIILRYHDALLKNRATTIQDLTNKIALFYTENLLITIHKSETSFIEAIRRRYDLARKCSSTTEIIAKITWNALETFDEPANHLFEKVDFYENDVMTGKIKNDQMEALYHVKREASLAYKVLVLMQEPINHIFPKPGEEPIIRDVMDQHLKMKTLYSQVLDDVNNLMNLFLAFSSQKTNAVMKVLTIFSVFFMPLTFIVGIYGMNFEFMPELRQRWGYPGVMIFMAIVTILIYTWFKRKKWL
jgi:magnesium transporter